MGEDRELASAEYAAWLLPKTAINFAPSGLDLPQRLAWLTLRLSAGVIDAAARSAVLRTGDQRSQFDLRVIGQRFWNPPWQATGEDWFDTGDLQIQRVRYEDVNEDDAWGPGPLPIVVASMIFFEVRIDPAGLQRVESAPPPRRPGGAKRKGWWDDLWVEMIRRMEAGSLNPATAVELESIMGDYLDDLGFSPGDSTLKPMSLKLFKYLQERGGK